MPPDAGDGLVEVLHRGLLDRRRPRRVAGRPAGVAARPRPRPRPAPPRSSVESVVERVRARVDGLGPLEPLLADPVGRRGHAQRGRGACGSSATAGSSARRSWSTSAPRSPSSSASSRPLGLRVDRSSPLVDARLPDGSRVNAVVRPLAVDGPCLTIRRFGPRAVDLDEVARPGTAAAPGVGDRGPRQPRRLRRRRAPARPRCSTPWPAAIPDHERVVTVEDAAELRLPRPPRRAARGPAGQRRGRRRGAHPRPGAQRPAHAPRPHRRRRGPRRRGPRHVAGHEHRPRGLAVDVPRQLARPTPCAGSRRWCSWAMSRCPSPRCASRSARDRPRRAGLPSARRQPAGHRGGRGRGERRGRCGPLDPAPPTPRAGWSPCRCARRGPRRPPPRPTPG